MNDILQAIMDADTALKRAMSLAERDEVIPICNNVGTTMYFNCTCGTATQYGDQYCRMCGRKINWSR